MKRDSANGKRLPSSPLFSVCRERTAELTERNASATDAHHFSASRASRIRSAAHPDQDVRAKITQLNENKNASKRCVTAVTFTELMRKLSEHQQRSRRNTERHSCSFWHAARRKVARTQRNPYTPSVRWWTNQCSNTAAHTDNLMTVVLDIHFLSSLPCLSALSLSTAKSTHASLIK